MEPGFLIHHPSQIKGNLLDKYLSAGWYRYGNKIFTIDFFSEKEILYPVFWLRYNVERFKLTGTSKEIIRKNRKFNVTISSFKNSEELEELHDLYFESIDFTTTSTIQELMEDVENNVYDSMLIEIRDNEKLIAAGIFDCGQNSIAGIKNIFNPEYKKYSLGKYLMLLKMQYCIDNKLNWYYPGYFAPGYKKFDYKLKLDPLATELCLTANRKWIPYSEFKISD